MVKYLLYTICYFVYMLINMINDKCTMFAARSKLQKWSILVKTISLWKLTLQSSVCPVQFTCLLVNKCKTIYNVNTQLCTYMYLKYTIRVQCYHSGQYWSIPYFFSKSLWRQQFLRIYEFMMLQLETLQ